MSYDFSNRPDLDGLARVVGALGGVARPRNVTTLLIGATARDLLLTYAHGVHVPRLTQDVDFAVAVSGWDEYQTLRQALLDSGAFQPRPGVAEHRLRHRDGLPLDIIPFGGVERPDRTYAWPPDHHQVFDCFGLREALAQAVIVRLPHDTEVLVAPVHAQALLKIAAWHDRGHGDPRDAGDLFLMLRSYLDLGNMERAATEHADLFEADAFDREEGGVRLLVRDVRMLLDADGIERLLQLLVPEADEQGRLLLASQSGLDLERARRLIEVMCDELAGGVS